MATSAPFDLPDFILRMLRLVDDHVRPAFGDIKEHSNEMVREIRSLKDRVAQLEAEKISFRGVWRSDESYKKGSLVMRSGSAFIAINGSRGHDPDAMGSDKVWAMAVQRGRNAR